MKAAYVVLIIILLWAITQNCAESINEFMSNYNNAKPVVLFWTGGVHSTLRLCQLLMDENKYVMPIYIFDDTVDRIHGGVKGNNDLYKMHCIIDQLHAKHPKTRKMLAQTKIIRNVRLDRDAINTMELLHHLGFTARSANQYAYIAQVITDFAIKNAEVGVVVDRPEIAAALQDRMREINWSHAIKPDCASLYDNHKFVDRNRLEAYWFNKLPYTQDVVDYGFQPTAWERPSCKNNNTITYPAYNLRKNDLFNYAEEQGYGDTVSITKNSDAANSD